MPHVRVTDENGKETVLHGRGVKYLDLGDEESRGWRPKRDVAVWWAALAALVLLAALALAQAVVDSL